MLTDHSVSFVLIGGMAASARGSPSVTFVLDICYERSLDNLERLASALVMLEAKPRGAPEDVPFLLDAKTLMVGDHFTFTTYAGAFDVFGTPAGVSGYDDLVGSATPMDLGGFEILVASVDDLMRMKKAAGRRKDLIELEVLGALRDELEARGEL